MAQRLCIGDRTGEGCDVDAEAEAEADSVVVLSELNCCSCFSLDAFVCDSGVVDDESTVPEADRAGFAVEAACGDGSVVCVAVVSP